MLPLPDLAARRWRDLVDEGVTLLPRYAPGWTDYNATDPGITLLELVAWLVEAGLYRADRVPDRHRRAFLRALGAQAAGAQPARWCLRFGPRPQLRRCGRGTVFVNSEEVAVTTVAEVAVGTGVGAELVRVAARQTVRATGSMPVTAAVARRHPRSGHCDGADQACRGSSRPRDRALVAPPRGGVDGQAPEVTLLELSSPRFFSKTRQLVVDLPEHRGVTFHYPARNLFVARPRRVRDNETAIVGFARGAQNGVVISAIDHFDEGTFARDAIDARLGGPSRNENPGSESKERRNVRNAATVITVGRGD